MRRPRNTDWLSDDSPMAGESASACAIDSSTSRRCSRVISGRLLAQHVFHRPLAPGPAEDEVDRRQPAALVQRLDQHGGIDHAPRVPARGIVRPARLVAHHAGAPATHVVHLVDLAGQIGDRVVQRHRAPGMRDGHDGPVHERDPVGDLLDVGHRGRQPDQRDVLRRADDDLLPHGAAALVAHVVALVEDDVAEVVEAAAVERVAEDLGGHHHHRGVRVDLHVAGQDADALLAVGAGEVAELLVAQRLERRGVGDADAALQGRHDGELGDQRLAGAGGGRDDHRLIRLDRADRLQLEVIQRERIPGAEPLDEVHPSHGNTRATEGRRVRFSPRFRRLGASAGAE